MLRAAFRPRFIGFAKFTENCLPAVWFPKPIRTQRRDWTKYATRAVEGIAKFGAVGIEGGHGKTTIAMAVCLWAAFDGLRRFPILLCRDDAARDRARLAMAAAIAEQTHGSLDPFFPESQVFSIGDSVWHNLSRPVPGISSREPRSGGVGVHLADLLVIDDPAPVMDAKLQEILGKVREICAEGQRPVALLLGSPALAATLKGQGWDGD